MSDVWIPTPAELAEGAEVYRQLLAEAVPAAQLAADVWALPEAKDDMPKLAHGDDDTRLERIASSIAAGEPLAEDGAWLLDQLSRLRRLLRRRRRAAKRARQAHRARGGRPSIDDSDRLAEIEWLLKTQSVRTAAQACALIAKKDLKNQSVAATAARLRRKYRQRRKLNKTPDAD